MGENHLGRRSNNFCRRKTGRRTEGVERDAAQSIAGRTSSIRFLFSARASHRVIHQSSPEDDPVVGTNGDSSCPIVGREGEVRSRPVDVVGVAPNGDVAAGDVQDGIVLPRS